MNTHTENTTTPGSHAAPIASSRGTDHLITICANCGQTIKRETLSGFWFHYQTDEIDCVTNA